MNQTQISDGGEVIINKRPLNLGPIALAGLVFAVIFVFAIGVGLAITLFYPRTLPPAQNIIGDELPDKTRALPIQKNPNPRAVPIINDVDAWLSEVDSLDLIEAQLVMPDLDLKIGIPVE